MYDRLKEVKQHHEAKKKIDFFGVTLHPRDIDWLIEQAEKVEQQQQEIEELKEDVKRQEDLKIACYQANTEWQEQLQKAQQELERYKKSLQYIYGVIQDEASNEFSTLTTLAQVVREIENKVIDVWQGTELVNKR